MKTCRKCERNLPETDFEPQKHKCRSCKREYARNRSKRPEIRAANTELKRVWRRDNRHRYNQLAAVHRDKNRENACTYAKRWRQDHPEYAAQYRRENLSYFSEYAKRYRKTSPVGLLRSRCTFAASRLKFGKFPYSKLKLLPYTPTEFEVRLQQTLPINLTLQQAVMDGWHLDHIVPISHIASLPLSDDLKLRVAMDLSNLRMLPASENLSRGVGKPEEWQQLLQDILNACEIATLNPNSFHNEVQTWPA